MHEQLKQYNDRVRLYKRYGFDIRLAKGFTLDKAGLEKGSILEIGTGRGYMAVALLKRGKKFVSIDIDRAAQKNAGICLEQMSIDSGITLRIMNAEKLKYKDGAFDYVISTNTLHHFERPRRCLKEIIRVTKKKIIISDFNKKGASIINKIHKLEGKEKHHMEGMSIPEARDFLVSKGVRVKTFFYMGETTLIGEKGE